MEGGKERKRVGVSACMYVCVEGGREGEEKGGCECMHVYVCVCER